ncbi:hypothetical protein GPECTOR_67g266 [Gonium pectorale]|uniref:Uncharacterized protein n=1 Tax=Gonium pectorale TaxID=33097 RepID=A0A150G3H6_GONPE|nr:hypothetical protein GPECTOR_67g266 [Gonium pectorale]|eukprot:KXZ44426.1 hypothetical protein GPECTOR_67g266 [Gonium pectorale]
MQNPFTPGLNPVSVVPKPSYAVADPLRERYPAARAPDDPLNWISEDLFSISQQRDQVSQQRASLRNMAARPGAAQ